MRRGGAEALRNERWVLLYVPRWVLTVASNKPQLVDGTKRVLEWLCHWFYVFFEYSKVRAESAAVAKLAQACA